MSDRNQLLVVVLWLQCIFAVIILYVLYFLFVFVFFVFLCFLPDSLSVEGDSRSIELAQVLKQSLSSSDPVEQIQLISKVGLHHMLNMLKKNMLNYLNVIA